MFSSIFAYYLILRIYYQIYAGNPFTNRMHASTHETISSWWTLEAVETWRLDQVSHQRENPRFCAHVGFCESSRFQSLFSGITVWKIVPFELSNIDFLIIVVSDSKSGLNRWWILAEVAPKGLQIAFHGYWAPALFRPQRCRCGTPTQHAGMRVEVSEFDPHFWENVHVCPI